jgi:hypothetical protein
MSLRLKEDTEMKTFLLATVIAQAATQAHAETYTYACEIMTNPTGNTVDQRFETHLAKIVANKPTCQWRGTT